MGEPHVREKQEVFESRDGGRTWVLNRPLWDDPSRPEWIPGNGGLMVHTICPWPGDPSRLLNWWEQTK